MDLEFDDEENSGFGITRDIPLRFMFDIAQKEMIRDRLRVHGLARMKKRWAAAQLSILASAVKAYPSGKWISYSRNRSFYKGKKRYFGTSYFYDSVINAIDQAAEHGLLENRIAKAQSQAQSKFRATPELVALFKDVNIAVGTPVTGRPPHRSVRAEFPHTAPTSGV